MSRELHASCTFSNCSVVRGDRVAGSYLHRHGIRSEWGILRLYNGWEGVQVRVFRRSEQEAHYYFAQIVSGLEYLHRLGIAHRDIKPENMLLDVQNRLKIVDFGLSNMYKNGEHLLTACGSPCYASP